MSTSPADQPQTATTKQRTGPRSRLHPAKIRAAVRRRLFERRLERTPLRPAGTIATLGDPRYGGWKVPEAMIGEGWICYCVGAGGDVSFDMDLIRRHGATVRAIDPVEKYVEQAIEESGGDPRFTIERAALATSDGPLRMQVTHDLGSESVSPAGLYDSSSFVELPGRTLASLMRQFGDERIDLLKVDIEGGEYELIPTLDLQGIGVRIFATQLHHTGSIADARRLIGWLGAQGYEPVASHPVVKLTFARRDLLDGPSARGGRNG